MCDVSGDTDLDDFIEVTFSVAPQLRRLPFHDPDTLSVEDFHWKLHFGNEGRLPGQQIRFLDVLRGFVRGMTFLSPETNTFLRAEVGPGALSGVNVETQAAFALPVTGDPVSAPTLVKIGWDGKRFLPALPSVAPDPVVIEVESTAPRRGALLLINWPPG